MEICFVLVAPAVPENVGAAARALKTMGFSCLRVVASHAHCEKGAQILAHGARDLLDAVVAFDDLSAALADCDLVIGTSAKPRAGKRFVLAPEQLPALLTDKGDALQRVALVFGREESGLSNEELSLCDVLTAVPMATSYPSLNLGQAVMLYAYQLRALAAAADEPMPAAPGAADASGEWKTLQQRVRELLDALAIDPQRALHGWALERLTMADRNDVQFLHLLLNALARQRATLAQEFKSEHPQE